MGPNDILRFFLELAAVFIVGIWGFLTWPMPWSLVIGLGGPVFIVLLWALFRSPRAVFHMDLFGRSLVEILVMFAATLALWELGVTPWVVAAFALLALVSGLVNGLRELASR